MPHLWVRYEYISRQAGSSSRRDAINYTFIYSTNIQFYCWWWFWFLERHPNMFFSSSWYGSCEMHILMRYIWTRNNNNKGNISTTKNSIEVPLNEWTKDVWKRRRRFWWAGGGRLPTKPKECRDATLQFRDIKSLRENLWVMRKRFAPKLITAAEPWHWVNVHKSLKHIPNKCAIYGLWHHPHTAHKEVPLKRSTKQTLIRSIHHWHGISRRNIKRRRTRRIIKGAPLNNYIFHFTRGNGTEIGSREKVRERQRRVWGKWNRKWQRMITMIVCVSLSLSWNCKLCGREGVFA